jgi:ABC-type uncharacterized transport system permease subunit
MEALLGTTIPVFVGVTVILAGFAAFMTGQALATTWKPLWHVLLYCLLLGLADRFLVWALFQGQMLLLSGYLIDTAVIMAVAISAYRLTLARRVTAQYPWLYQRTGPFSWREKKPNSWREKTPN